MTGQFVIRVSEATPGTAPTTPQLLSGQPVSGSLASGETITYTVTGGTSELVLSVEGNPTATLLTALGETAGIIGSGGSLNGGAFYLSPGADTYQLQLSNSTGAPLAYTASLNPRGVSGSAPVPTATPQGATAVPLPVLPSTGDCVLATAQNVYVNIRRGATTDDEVVSRSTRRAPIR